jgi:lysophospholipase L1-like esterase
VELGQPVPGLAGTIASPTKFLTDQGLTSGSVYYYRAVVRDSAGNTLITPQAVGVTASTPARLVLGFIGDSTSVFAPTTTSIIGGRLSIPNAMANLLSSDDGWHNVTIVNQAISGSTTSDWLPDNSNGYYAGARAAFATAGVRWVFISLGINDSSTADNYAAATYRANLQAIIADLVSSGFNEVINGPFYTVPGSEAGRHSETSVALEQSYLGVIPSLADGVHVFAGSVSDAFLYFAMNQGDLVDGVHPNLYGAQVVAGFWERAFRKILALP